MKPTRAFLFAVLACTACGPTSTPPATAPAAPAVAPPADVRVEAWPLPVSDGAAQPDLVRAPDGSLLLSWIERDGDAHVLRFAGWRDGRWNEPRTIARGRDWFVNWADTPHIAMTADGALWAHWLQKSAAATYAYDVALVRSADGGATWSKPVLVNDDGTPTEHGFVSLWPASNDRLGIAWLDGRRTAGGGHDGHDAGAAPAAMMTLRHATFDAALERHGERELDLSACDCCQTDAATSSRGPLLVYRDRTADEIRDIHIAALDADAPSMRVHADQWRMPACPVNGPSLDAQGDAVVVGWYTAAGNVPTLKLARSNDAGRSFAAPVVVDRGEPMLGRVDVQLGTDTTWVGWMREDAQGQSVQLARYRRDLSGEPRRTEVARVAGRGRGTGFPQLVVAGDSGHLVWTELVDGRPRLQGARLVTVR